MIPFARSRLFERMYKQGAAKSFRQFENFRLDKTEIRIARLLHLQCMLHDGRKKRKLLVLRVDRGRLHKKWRKIDFLLVRSRVGDYYTVIIIIVSVERLIRCKNVANYLLIAYSFRASTNCFAMFLKYSIC